MSGRTIQQVLAAGGVFVDNFGVGKGTLTINQNSITNPTAAVGSVEVAVGDLIYVVCEEQTDNTWGTCSDNLGNTYTAVSAGTDLSSIASRQYWCVVTNAGTLTSVSVTATASTNNCVIIASVITGVFAASSAIDANPSPVTDDVTDPMTGPATGTLSQANEVIMAFAATNGNPTVTVDAPFTQDLEANSGTTLNLTVAHLLVAATTTITPTFDLSGSPTTSILGTASFKKA